MIFPQATPPELITGGAQHHLFALEVDMRKVNALDRIDQELSAIARKIIMLRGELAAIRAEDDPPTPRAPRGALLDPRTNKPFKVKKAVSGNRRTRAVK